MKDIYSENYKTLLRGIAYDTKKMKYLMLLDWKH